MRIRGTSLIFLIVFFLNHICSSQTYVNLNASGTNDGSSWENAFTDLQSALDQTETSEIWVAEGTYYPPEQEGMRSFICSHSAAIYGGFSGTETQIEERNYESNLTIIDGDIEGDDVTDLMLNRDDNAQHLVYFSGIENSVAIDGFILRNGATSFVDNDIEIELRGGAIYSQSELTVLNCRFENNIAYRGGAICVDQSPALIENCSFNNNMSIAQGIVLFDNCDGPMVFECSFENNQVVRGCIYTLDGGQSIIDQCEFNFNEIALDGWGGVAIFNWNSPNSMITNSSFNSNIGGNASGIYLDGRELGDEVQASIENCIFENNTQTDYGGCVYAWRSNYEMRACEFTGNSAPNSACFYNGNSEFLIETTSFITNTSEFGGAGANYNEETRGTFIDCDFLFNEGLTSGGACMVGFKANVDFENCFFEANNARWGGAVYIQNDTTKASFSNCRFSSNTAENFGGAINNLASAELDILDCEFTSNSSNFGGALAFDLDTMVTQGYLNIERSQFGLNIAETQGGALNIGNTPTNIISTLFYLNTAENIGTGGAICNNSFSFFNSVLDISHCTFAHNIGDLAGGIAQYEEEGSKARVNLLNSILYNPNYKDYGVEEGEPLLNSLGGNMALQLDLEEQFIGEQDLLGEDPLFVSLNERDFHLQTGSPGINGGISEGAHEIDLEGNPIVEEPDKGCYDRGVSNTNDYLSSSFITILENPIIDKLQIQIKASIDVNSILLLNEDGRFITNQFEEMGVGEYSLDVSKWISGIYYVHAITKQGLITVPVVIVN